MRVVFCLLSVLTCSVLVDASTGKNQGNLKFAQSVNCIALADSGPVVRTSSTGEVQVLNGVYQGVAQQFDNLAGQQISGVSFSARVNPASGSASNNLKVSIYSAAQGLPGSILKTQNIAVNASSTAGDYQVSFATPLTVSGSIIIAVEPLSPFTDDFFITRNAPPDGLNLNLIKVKQANQWFKNLAAGDPAFDYDFMILPLKTTSMTASFSSSAVSGTISFQNNSSGAVSYEWDFGDGNTSLAANPQHTYSVSGSYDVQLKAFSNGTGTCIDSVTNVINVAITGVDELQKPETVELLNGTVVKNELLLSCTESQVISIYSAAGAKCGDFELRAGEVKTINLTDYAAGVYILHGSFKPIRFMKNQ
jgi:PKD repeat protein